MVNKRNTSSVVQEVFGDEDQSLRQYWDVFRRYKVVFILITLIVFSIGLYQGYSTPDQYEANVELKKASGFKHSKQLLANGFTTDNQIEDIETVVTSREVRKKTMDFLKEALSSSTVSSLHLTDFDLRVADSITPDSLASMCTFEIDADFDSRATLYITVPNSGKVAALVANAYGRALAEVANAISLRTLKHKEDMILRLQADKEREIKSLEAKLNEIQNINITQSAGLTVTDKDSLISLLNTTELKLQQSKLNLEILTKSDNFLRKMLGVKKDADINTVKWVYNEEPLVKKLEKLKVKRDEYRVRYTEKNPLVKKVTKQIKALEERIAKGNKRSDNVVYVDLSYRDQVATLIRNNIQKERLYKEIELYVERSKKLKKKLLAEPDLKIQILSDQITVLNRILTDLRKEYQRLKIMSTSDFNRITVVSQASVPTRPLPSTRVKVAIFALFVGLLLACIAVFILNGWNNTVLNSNDLKRYIDYPVLGVIPYWDNKAAYINPQEPDSSIAEIYSVLRNNIKFSTQEDPSSCLMVASAVQNEGKSHTSINLAISFALEGNSVLLMTVDLRTERNYAKLRRPEDRDKLGVGLSEYLQDDLSKEELIHPSYIDNLYLIPSGSKAKNPTYLLRSEKFTELVEQAKSHFDVIIMDAPASLPVVDSAVVSNQVAGVLMVIEAGKTPINVFEQALARLEHVNSPIIGAVVNKVRDLGMDSFYGSGYSYYPNYYKASYRAGYKATYKSTYTGSEDTT